MIDRINAPSSENKKSSSKHTQNQGCKTTLTARGQIVRRAANELKLKNPWIIHLRPSLYLQGVGLIAY